MNNIQQNIEKFNTELSILRTSLESWSRENTAQSTQNTKDLDEIKRQREDLIKKQNVILSQVNSMRTADENANSKLLEAKKLKDSAVMELEKAERMVAETKTREDELDLREKKIVNLEQREADLSREKKDFEVEKSALNEAQVLLKREQELLDEKQKVILIREKKLDIEQAKIKRIYSGI